MRPRDWSDQPLELNRETIEAIAEHVAEVLRDVLHQPRLVSAGEIAQQFSVSRSWVYNHAAELGGRKLGDGRGARLRFNPTEVTRAIARMDQASTASRRQRLAPNTPDHDLLPIYGQP